MQKLFILEKERTENCNNSFIAGAKFCSKDESSQAL